MTIAIIGGTGPQGQGLALRFARAGVSVALGSRDATRAAEISQELTAKLPKGSAAIVGLGNSDAVTAADEFVILAVPWLAHNATLETIKAGLHGKILVDIVVPLAEGDPKKFICRQRGQPLRRHRRCWVPMFQLSGRCIMWRR